MDASHKRILKAISLELRDLLEGDYDAQGRWRPGDLERCLAALGVRRDRDPVPVDELSHLSEADVRARQVVDGYLDLCRAAAISRKEAIAEFVRETAYTWANRLLALRCMEARELIDTRSSSRKTCADGALWSITAWPNGSPSFARERMTVFSRFWTMYSPNRWSTYPR